MTPILLGALLTLTVNGQTSNERSTTALTEELRLSGLLINALERENAALRQRIEIEKQAAFLLTELAETRKAETGALRDALAAKNETIAAKQAVITSQEKLIAKLGKRRGSIWKRIADIAAGAVIGAILR